jgi:8-oxo-dGTP diphosphatase
MPKRRASISNVAASPEIAAAVIVHDGRVLLVRRRVAEGSLSWQFPAGKIGPGESAEDAAVRETLEETGLSVTAREVLGSRVHPVTGKLLAYVACDPVGGTARVASRREIAEVAWCGRGDLGERVPTGFAAEVTAYLATRLTDTG